MWIEATKEGKYKYIERYFHPQYGKNKRVSVTLEKNSKQAWNQAQKILNDKINKTLEAYELEQKRQDGFIDNEYTFEDMALAWFEEYSDERRQDAKKGSTIGSYSYGMDRLLRDFMKEEKMKLIKEFTFEDVQNIYNYLIFDLGFKKSYVKRFRGIIRGTFTYAYKNRYIRSLDPITFSSIRTPAETVESLQNKQIPRYLEKDELDDLLKILYEQNYLYTQIFELQALTGMRAGEVLALEETDLHDDFLLDVHGTIDSNPRSRTYRQKVPPKTKKSFRTIALGDRPQEILKERITYNALHFKKRKNKYIFVSANDRTYDLGTLNEFLGRFQKQYKTKTKVSTHIFRHTHISLLAEADVPLLVIMERVGHEDRETTEKIYTHVTRKQRASLLEVLNSL